MNWYPKTKLGKISFWVTLVGFINWNYLVVMIFGKSIPIPFGLTSIALMLIFGTISIILIIRNKDRAILLFLSALLGLFAWCMLIGDFLFPH
ncbi:MAG: hypothetical protein ABH811_01060 [archaeon]